MGKSQTDNLPSYGKTVRTKANQSRVLSAKRTSHLNMHRNYWILLVAI